jgi:hypothetical protein
MWRGAAVTEPRPSGHYHHRRNYQGRHLHFSTGLVATTVPAALLDTIDLLDCFRRCSLFGDTDDVPVRIDMWGLGENGGEQHPGVILSQLEMQTRASAL